MEKIVSVEIVADLQHPVAPMFQAGRRNLTWIVWLGCGLKRIGSFVPLCKDAVHSSINISTDSTAQRLADTLATYKSKTNQAR